MVLRDYSGVDATLEEIMWMFNQSMKRSKVEQSEQHINRMLLDERRSKEFNNQLDSFFSLKGKEL